MATEHSNLQQTMTVPAHAEAGEAQPNVMAVSTQMMILTWVTFILVTVVLYRVAWKPILAALQKREDDIRQALEGAARAREEVARLAETRAAVLAEAEKQARQLVEDARQTAVQTADALVARARQESHGLVENARREIEVATTKARATLRQETAGLVVQLTGQLLGEELQADRQRALTDRLIKQL